MYKELSSDINNFFFVLILCCVTYRRSVTRLDDAVVLRVASVGVSLPCLC